MQFNHAQDFHFCIILDIFLEHYQVSPAEFTQRKHNAMYAYSHYVLSQILKIQANYGQSKIGRIINKNHSTVHFYFRQHDKCIATKAFGYEEMYNLVLFAYLQRVSAPKAKTCHPCRYSPSFLKGGG